MRTCCTAPATRSRTLRAAWDEGQIVEITLVIGMTEYFNRFNDSLRVEPTR